MSNLFTYEIDERNLRVQLKNIEVPMKEEAWHKFENYLTAHPPVPVKNSFRGININLSRNVVLPAVFGLIIFLFSFLLFNFVSINNTNAQKAETKEIINPPAVAKTEVSTEKKQIVETAVLPQPEPTVKSMPVAQSPAPVTETVPQASTENKGKIADADAIKTEASQPIVHKKKSRRLLEEEALSAIKPSLVSEDENVEVAPE